MMLVAKWAHYFAFSSTKTNRLYLIIYLLLVKSYLTTKYLAYLTNANWEFYELILNLGTKYYMYYIFKYGYPTLSSAKIEIESNKDACRITEPNE